MKEERKKWSEEWIKFLCTRQRAKYKKKGQKNFLQHALNAWGTDKLEGKRKSCSFAVALPHFTAVALVARFSLFYSDVTHIAPRFDEADFPPRAT